MNFRVPLSPKHFHCFPVLSLMTLMAVMTFAASLTSCHGPKSKRNPGVGPAKLPPIEGLTLVHEGDFSAQISQIFSMADGGLILLGWRQPTVENNTRGFIVRRDSAGRTVYTKDALPDQVYVSAASHQDRSLSILEYRGIPEFDGALFELDVVRFDAFGKEEKRTSLHSFSDAVFDSAAGCYLDADAKPVFASLDAVNVVAIGEDLIVSMYACYQHVLVRLSKNHELLWLRRLTPQLPSRWLYQPSLILSGSDVPATHVLLALHDAEDVAVAAGFLGVSLPPGDGKHYAIRVELNQSSGELSNVQLIVLGEDQKLVGGKINGQNLYVFGIQSRLNDRGTSARKNDLLLGAFDLGELNPRWSKTFDFGNEQMPNAMAIATTGEILIGGRSGHVVVDTGSTIEFPDGIVAAFDPNQGSFIGGSRIATKRSDSVRAILSLDGNHILIGGALDGPITHTADNDRNLAYSHAFLQDTSLEAVKNGTLELAK
jgi:hypothetical protein